MGFLTIFIALVVIAAAFLIGKEGASQSQGSVSDQSAKKTENKEKILKFMLEKEQVTNNDVEKLLGVSDSTATRYLDELEEEGKINQVGTTGQGVFYTLK